MPFESVVVVEVSSTSMVLLLISEPVWPPWIWTPVTLSLSWNWMMPELLTALLLLMVTATPDAGLIVPLELMVRSPVVAVATGAVVPVPIVVWASAWPAQTSAVRLTRGGPNRRIRVQRRASDADPAAFGEKYPVISTSIPCDGPIDRARLCPTNDSRPPIFIGRPAGAPLPFHRCIEDRNKPARRRPPSNLHRHSC